MIVQFIFTTKIKREKKGTKIKRTPFFFFYTMYAYILFILLHIPYFDCYKAKERTR